jgi:hypothetical protein
MRLVGNPRRGRFRFAPMPLELCPGRLIWERFRNREYLVFFDESAFEFFGFQRPDGSFCHAAVGLPTENYAQLQASFAPTLDQYRRQVLGLTGTEPREIKFSTLRILPRHSRLRFTRELVRNLTELGGFVAGFYTTTRGTIMECVRNGLPEGVMAVPVDHAREYDQARTDLLNRFQGVGQARIIESLLITPFSSIWSLLNSFDCTFRVQYDPRQAAEDQAVREALGNYMGRLLAIPELFGPHNIYRGMAIDRRSEDELGLQLADVVAGQVREFFRQNPAALTTSATLNLITPDSDEPLQQFQELAGRIFKRGVLSRMPGDLLRVLRDRNGTNPISYYFPILAAGILTCVSDTGQLRLLEIPTRTIFDLLD